MTAAEKKELLNYLMTSPAVRVRAWTLSTSYSLSNLYFCGTVDFHLNTRSGDFIREAKYDSKVKLGKKESEALRKFCEEKVKEAERC